MHECKNENYVPLIYTLLLAKDQQCYELMWQIICYLCREKQLSFMPDVIHIDFEQAMHVAILDAVPQCRIDCAVFIWLRTGGEKSSLLDSPTKNIIL